MYHRLMNRIIALALLFLAVPLAAQQIDLGADRPSVQFNSHNIELQSSLYPTYYRNAAATEDMRWVQSHTAAIDSFWLYLGDSVLTVISELAGVAWEAGPIAIHLLRYYPTLGNADPMILPVGGLRVGALAEAMPDGAPAQLNLIYHLAQRILLKASQVHSDAGFGLANHPLAQPGPYHRDLLAFHLAYSTAKLVLGPDSAVAAYESPFWKRNLLGRELYEQYLRSTWILSADKPLVAWLAKESYDSRLLLAIAPMADRNMVGEPGVTIEGLSRKGTLGFSVRINDTNQLVVDKIDESRACYKSGLRSGDIIVRVVGVRPKTHKELIELILQGLDRGAVAMTVSRAGKTETVLVRK